MNKLIFFITFSFVSLQIFLPKIYLFGVPIYFFTILYASLLFLLIFTNTQLQRHTILISYIYYVSYLALTTLISGMFHNFSVWSIFLYDLKYLLPLLLLPLIDRYHYIFNLHFLELVYRSQVTFCFIVFLYVVWNMVMTPLDITHLSGGYSQTHRFIGYTGYVFSEGSVVRLGNTSVAMGIYVALIFFIAFFKYLKSPSFLKLITLGILFLCLLFTYSRSGLICVSVGIMLYSMLSFRKKNVLGLYAIIAVTLSFLLLQIGLENILNLAGSIGKFIVYISLVSEGTIQFQRLVTWQSGLDFIVKNPLLLLVGYGHGESLVEHVTGIGFYESLFFQALIEGGLIGLSLLILHFGVIGVVLQRMKRTTAGSDIFEFVQALYFFFPGFLLANAVGGNLWQTDFFAPLFYCIIAICLTEMRKIISEVGS